MLHPLRIYQLDDVVLHLFEESWPGYNTSFNASPIDMLHSDKKVWPEQRFQPQSHRFQIRGLLLNRNGLTKDQILNRLNQAAGYQIDVFAYTFMQCCDEVGCNCACVKSAPFDELLWLHTIGSLEKVDATREKKGKFEVVLTISTAATWQPVNRFIWQYRAGKYSNLFKHETPVAPEDNLKPYPRLRSIFNFCSEYLWAKRVYSDEFIHYDPDVWDILHDFHRITFDYQTGAGHTWTDNTNSFFYFADRSIWSAPPSSVYAFRIPQLQETKSPFDSISIEVIKAIDAWQSDVQISTLDLIELNSDLVANGLAAIGVGDVIYAGDGKVQPSFIVRNGQIINGIIPNWTYPDSAVGVGGLGSNYVRITVPDIMEYAQVHTFRRL